MKLKPFVLPLLGTLLCLVATTGPTLWSNSVKADESEPSDFIDVDEESLNTRYGAYSETQFNFTRVSANSSTTVQWEVVSSTLPAGLELEDSEDSKILIFGTPQFTGRWCFVLSARAGDEIAAEREICYLAEDNSEQLYPDSKLTAIWSKVRLISPTKTKSKWTSLI